MNVYCACICRRRLEQCWDTLIKHVRQQRQTPENSLFVLFFYIYIYIYTNMTTLETETDLSERLESFATRVNILKMWKGFSSAECSVVELPWERVWNEIEELKTTRHIYTDSSVMIVTPCGTYWRLGSWNLGLFRSTCRKIEVYFGKLCFKGTFMSLQHANSLRYTHIS